MKKFFKWFGYSLLILVVGLMAFSVIKSIVDYEPPQEPTQMQKDSTAIAVIKEKIQDQEDHTWHYSKVVAVYSNNELKGEKYFKGKYFYVKGKVNSVGKDITGEAYVMLGNAYDVGQVQCFFEDGDPLMDLKKGHNIVIEGKGRGYLLNVFMEDCKIAEDLPSLKKELAALEKEFASKYTEQ